MSGVYWTYLVHGDEAGKGLRRLQQTLEVAVNDAVREATRMAHWSAYHTTTFKDRTGTLRNSIFMTFVPSHQSLVEPEGEVTAGAEYALYVDEDTVEHPIVARAVGGGASNTNGAQFLAFVGHGGLTFRRRVMHPGTKGKHFMDEAVIVGNHVLGLEAERRITAAIDEYNDGGLDGA